MDYARLVPLLIESIKEKQKKIEVVKELQQKINEQQKQIDQLLKLVNK